ncbi:MAG: Wzz/FepE/Etk N-terminal domain-containing protein [Chloroflexi bacterium]|nr:Wzz/FepE/Etk N-terminal domain-containing protein [Chloroflexota bacterium]
MELQDYLQIARRRAWIVILVAVVAAASAYIVSKLQTPVYKSTMELFIQPARTDFGLTQSAQQLLSSYIGIIINKRNADELRQELGLDYSPDRIYENTKVASDAARFAVQIEVRDYDGDTANRIAKQWALLFVNWRDTENAKQRREDRVDAILGDEPVYHQDYPRTSVNTIAGGILGAVVGLLIVAALEWSQAGLLRKPSDVERKLSMPIIGAIPSE